jgi:5'-3' exonuclease
MRPILLIDGNNVLVRAVEATRQTAMTSPSGVSTSALVVVARTLSRYMRNEHPYKAIMLWDAGHTMRSNLYPPYKANRPTASDPYRNQSKALVRQFLALCRIPQLWMEGFEADDLIAAYWRTATAPVVILSNDKDLLQLVGQTPTGQSCEQIRPSSADTPTDRWDTAKVKEHFGCTPEQLPITMSLTGDSADHIPGVPGIGPKLAVKHLLAADWDLDAITHPAIAEHRDNGNVAIYRQLIDLREVTLKVPNVAPLMPTSPGPDRNWRDLHAFLVAHHLRDALNRLTAGTMWP